MKELSPPKVEELFNLRSFRESNREEINAVTKMLKKRGKELWVQASLADEARFVQVGEDVSFVINQNINFTQNCIGSCRFCSYRVELKENKTDKYRLSLDDIGVEIDKAIARGCTEVCVQGGLDPELSFDFYINILKTVKAKTSNIHIHAFSPSEIAFMSQISGESVEDIFIELKKNGLDSFPGTSAEILVDDIRRIICPDKISTSQWINITLTGHLVGLKSTSTMMYGHIESLEDQAEHLVLLKDIQSHSKNFTEFIPLPFIHTNTVLYRYLGARPGSTGMQDLALFSTARLYFGEVIPNIQASWVKLGPKFAQISLNTGVNDLGGTLYSEKITKSAGGSHGEEKTVEEFVELIRDSNRIPVQRDTLYNKLRTH